MRRLPRTIQRASGALVLLLCTSCSIVDNLLGLGPEVLIRKWFFSIPAASSGILPWNGSPALANGSVIVGIPGGLLALDTATGTQRWRTVALPGHNNFWGTILAANDAVCMVGDGLACFDAARGTLRWAASQDDTVGGTPDLASTDGTNLYYGIRSHTLRARSVSDGTLQWQTDLAPGDTALETVAGTAVRNDTVFAVLRQGFDYKNKKPAKVFAVDARTGAPLWTYTAPFPPWGDPSDIITRPLLYQNLVIVDDANSFQLIALDAGTGAEVWRTPLLPSAKIENWVPLAIQGDTILAGSTDTNLYAVNARTGAVLWQVDGGAGSIWGQRVCGGGIVIGQMGGGPLHYVDRQTHKATRAGSKMTNDNDDIESQIAVEGSTGFAVSLGGVYGFTCR